MPYTRITALWTGVAGLPGYTRLKFEGALDPAGATAAAARVRNFFQALNSYLPTGVVISFSEAAQVFSDTGVLQSEVGYAPPASVLGTASLGYAAPVGVVINWLTAGVFGGRKIRGRTFLVPMASISFFTDGTPSGAIVTLVNAQAQILLAGTPNMVITAVRPGGSSYKEPITGASMPDRAAVLTSRRG